MTDKQALRVERIETYGLPQYKLGEEIFNSVTHGFGAAASAVGLVFLILKARGAVATASAVIFAGVSIALYTVSCVYHGMGVGPAKKYLRVADHCTIFLMIGGCCTPFVFLALQGTARIVVLVGVWATGILGITLNMIDLKRFSKLSMACYIVMGWFVVGALPMLLRSMEKRALLLMLAGGLAYTVGAVIYGVGKKLNVPYVHTVYHFLVLAGTGLHYAMVYIYII